MKQTSKNAIIYRGRWIRRAVGTGWAAECYIIAWAPGGSERTMWYGSLKRLIEHLDDTIKFFGRWDRLI